MIKAKGLLETFENSEEYYVMNKDLNNRGIYDYCKRVIGFFNNNNLKNKNDEKNPVYRTANDRIFSQFSTFENINLTQFTEKQVFTINFDTDDNEYYTDPFEYRIQKSVCPPSDWKRPLEHRLIDLPVISYDFLSSSVAQPKPNQCPLSAAIKAVADYDQKNGTDVLKSLIFPQVKVIFINRMKMVGHYLIRMVNTQ